MVIRSLDALSITRRFNVVYNTYVKTAYVRMVVNKQASDIDLRTSPAMYSSALYGNP